MTDFLALPFASFSAIVGLFWEIFIPVCSYNPTSQNTNIESNRTLIGEKWIHADNPVMVYYWDWWGGLTVCKVHL